MKKRPRIYYASGMISLLLIPLFGYYFINKQISHNTEQRCIEIVMCRKDTSCNVCFKCIPPKRIYKKINITGDLLIDQKKLVSIDSIANTLFIDGDTVNGLEINFSDHSKYESLIKILDICKIRHIPIYMLKDYQFWMCFSYTDLWIGDKNYKTKIIGQDKRLLVTENYDYEIQIKRKPGYFVDDVIKVNNSISETMQRNRNIYDFIYQRKLLTGLLIFVYILMIIFTIRKLKKNLLN
ncbi:MAG: hypothetical protein Q8928_05605 [Bacteroidota bacterium]|nr:hypothetical protein [Bacteroidota bacterium]